MKNCVVSRSAVVGVCLAALMAGAGPSLSQVIIDNGLIQLGINPFGNLDVPAPGANEFNSVGLTFLPNIDAGGGEALSPGCLCEGWGLADFGVEATGFGRSISNGNTGDGTATVTASGTGTNPFSTGDRATSISDIVVGGNPFAQVTHDFLPSASRNLYRVEVTIVNSGSDPIASLRYRRVMDWDIPPTEFSEYVTLQGWPAARLVRTTNDGFEDPNPNVESTIIDTPGVVADGNFVNAGPADHGSLFDFDFGTLAPGEEIKFVIFYGAAANEAEALAALEAVGAEVYALGKANEAAAGGDPTVDHLLGTPNTFIFAFAGVGGTPLGAAGPDFLNAMREFGFLIARRHMSALQMRMDASLGGAERYPELATQMAALEAAEPVTETDGDGSIYSIVPTADLNIVDAYGVEGLRIFANGGYAFGELKSYNGNAETDYGMPFVNVGLDYGGEVRGAFVNNALVGLAIGYANVDGDVSGGSDVDTEGVTISAFGGINFGSGGYADATLSYSWLDYDYFRETETGGFDGSSDGDSWSAMARIGYDFELWASQEAQAAQYFKLGPYGQLEYVDVSIDGFDEELSFGLGTPLVIPDQDAESLTLQLGARAQYVHQTGFGAAILMGWAAWEHQFENDGEVLDLSTGTATIGDPDRDYGRAGVRLGAHFAPDLTAAIEFESSFSSSEFRDQAVVGRLRVGF
jgi:uncharacterized protein YhjY with autotransporter beta-barrel domain